MLSSGLGGAQARVRFEPSDAAKKLQRELREQQRLQEQQLRELCEGGPVIEDLSPQAAAGLYAVEAASRRRILGPQGHVPSPPTSPPAVVRLHPRIPAVLVLSGRGPCQVDYGHGELPEVVVNRFAGEAVLKGAHVFVPGVLAASPGITVGDLVAVSSALERPVGPFGHLDRAEGDDTDEVSGDDPAIHRALAASRMSVGISRGASVDRHGSVPLAWARQERRSKRRRQRQQEGHGQPHPPATGTLETRALRHEAGAEPENSSTMSSSGECAAKCDGGSCNDGDGTSSGSTCGDDGDSGNGGRESASSGRSDSGTCRSSSSSSSSSGRGTHSLRSERVYLGVARAAVGRRAMFRDQEGLALVMEKRVFEVPPCNGLLRGEVMLQALPSIVAAQVLNPRPGSRVLDMCAAPGGKTTALAALMGNVGQIVALDRTAAKVANILSLAEDLGATCVEAYAADAAEVVSATATAAPPQPQPPASTPPAVGKPPYPPGSFDFVLLDPPCSALGLRPRLLHSWSLKQMRSMAAYQRSLLHSAVRALKPGGEMVYCTCTINPDENEANVAWVLDRFSGTLELLSADPLVGLPGLMGSDPETGARWLTEREASMVQRFDPGQLLPGRQMASSEEAGAGVAAGLPHDAIPLDGPPDQAGKGSRSTIAEPPQPGWLAQPQSQWRQGWAVELPPPLDVDDVMGFFIARFRKLR